MKRADKLLYICFLAATCIGTALWRYAIYPVLDDLVYVHAVGGNDYWACGGALISSAGQLAESAVEHYRSVNGRLSNIVALGVLQLPHPVAAALGALALTVTAAAIVRLGAGRKLWLAPAAILLLWTALPWYDGMTSEVFYINYAWPSALMLGLFCCIESRRITARRGGMAACCALAFIASWFHESFAVAAGGYVAAYTMCGGLSKRRGAAVLALIAAGFLMNVAGATYARAVRALASPEGLAARSTMAQLGRSAVSQLWPLWAGAALACAALLRSKGTERKRLLKELAPAAGGIGVSLAFLLTVGALNRAAWGLLLCAVLMMLRAAAWLLQRPRGAAVWEAIALAIYIAWLAQLVSWQRMFAAEERAMAEQAACGKEVITTQITPAEEVPFELMGMMYHPAVETSDNNYVFSRHFAGRDGIAVLPGGTGEKVAGDNPFRICGNMLVCDAGALPDTVRIAVRFGGATRAVTPINRALAMACGKDCGFTAETNAVAGRVPGIYFTESCGRLSYGRKVERIDVLNSGF